MSGGNHQTAKTTGAGSRHHIVALRSHRLHSGCSIIAPDAVAITAPRTISIVPKKQIMGLKICSRDKNDNVLTAISTSIPPINIVTAVINYARSTTPSLSLTTTFSCLIFWKIFQQPTVVTAEKSAANDVGRMTYVSTALDWWYTAGDYRSSSSPPAMLPNAVQSALSMFS